MYELGELPHTELHGEHALQGEGFRKFCTCKHNLVFWGAWHSPLSANIYNYGQISGIRWQRGHSLLGNQLKSQLLQIGVLLKHCHGNGIGLGKLEVELYAGRRVAEYITAIL